jgi:drug/metabolite transporter (DMT)-like permease
MTTAGERRAVLMIIGAALGFASISLFVIFSTRAGTPLSMVLLGRYAVAAAVLGLWLRTRITPRVVGRGFAPLLIWGGIGQAVVASLSLSALAYIPAATLVFLFYTYPAWVTVLAAVRGSELLDRTKLLALGLSLLGIVCLVGLPGTAAVHPLGAALALAAAFAYALYIPLLRHLQRGVDARAASFLISAGVTVVFLVAAVWRREFTLALPAVSWWSIAVLGVACTAVAFILFLSGLAVLGSVRTSIVSTVEPLFASVLAALFLEQSITGPLLLGGALIATAVVLLNRGPSASEATSPREPEQRTR